MNYSWLCPPQAKNKPLQKRIVYYYLYNMLSRDSSPISVYNYIWKKQQQQQKRMVK